MQWLCRKEIVLEWIEISYSFWSFPSTYFSNGRENWNLITWLILRRHSSADYQIDKRGWQSTDLLLDLANYSQNTSLTSHMDCGQHDPSWDREDQTDQTQTQTTSHLPPTWRMLRGAGDRRQGRPCCVEVHIFHWDLLTWKLIITGELNLINQSITLRSSDA